MLYGIHLESFNLLITIVIKKNKHLIEDDKHTKNCDGQIEINKKKSFKII